MATPVMSRGRASGATGVGHDRREGYCPECGQSLNLSRRSADVAPRAAAGRWHLAFVGLCLVLLFGARTWRARGDLAGFDREIEARQVAVEHDVFGAPSNQATLLAESVQPLLPDRARRQQQLQNDLAGLALGLIGLVAGAGSWSGPLRRLLRGPRPAPAGTDGASPSCDALARIGARLWDAGGAAAASLFQVLLIAFGFAVAVQLARGVPPTLDLFDHALTRTVDVIVTVGGMLE